MKKFLLIFMLVIVIAAGSIWYQNRSTTESTDCFSISLPTRISKTITSNTCQLAAYTSEKSSPDSQILITTILSDAPSSIAQAKARLQAEHPNVAVETAQVGGYEAISQEGTSNGNGLGDRYVRTYIVLSPKTYQTAKGQVRAFFINLILPTNGQSEADRIINSLVWR